MSGGGCTGRYIKFFVMHNGAYIGECVSTATERALDMHRGVRFAGINAYLTCNRAYYGDAFEYRNSEIPQKKNRETGNGKGEPRKVS